MPAIPEVMRVAAGAISGRRYYSPSQGRFFGRDPRQELGGINLYAFCQNNSINRWDYLGMNSVLTSLKEQQALLDSSISILEKELDKLKGSGQDDQVTDIDIQRLTADLEFKYSELCSVQEQIYQLASSEAAGTRYGKWGDVDGTGRNPNGPTFDAWEARELQAVNNRILPGEAYHTEPQEPWHALRNANNLVPTSPPLSGTDGLGRSWDRDLDLWAASKGGPSATAWRASDGSEAVYDGSGNLLLNVGTFNYGTKPLGLQHLISDFLAHYKFGGMSGYVPNLTQVIPDPYD